MKPSRNLWPLAIISAFIFFITGTIGLVLLACSHRADLVSADYYEQEINFQGHLERVKRTQTLAANVVIAYHAAEQQITIALPSDQLGRVISGHIQLYRPSAAGLDRRVELKLDAKGIQSVNTTGLRPGLWKLRLSWTVQDKGFFIDQQIVIGS
jgi:hypothetical protein